MLRFSFAALLALCAWPVLAGPAPGPVNQTPKSPLEDQKWEGGDILKEVVKRAKAGKVDVPKARAALCPVCNQPLYRHSDPRFKCEPPAEYRNGELVRAPLKEMTSFAVRCPVCKVAFKAMKQGNINDDDGRDRDFCPHSVGRYAIHSSVWMCPDCGYAAVADSFDGRQKIKPEVAEFVRGKLTPKTRALIKELAGLREVEGKPIPPERLRFATYIEQPMIPDWAKYENALALIEAGHVRLPHGVKAKLYCEAAHSCRRFVAAEMNISLEDQRMQIGLGQSARRINDWLMAECVKVRENSRGEQNGEGDLAVRLMAYTQKPDTDPLFLQAAAAQLGRKIEEILRQESQQNDPNKPSRITPLDQYVFHMRYAGIWDRVGDLDAAEAQLMKAQSVIPVQPPHVAELRDAKAKAFVQRLLGSLRAAPVKRVELLKKERRLLFNAANHLLQALYFGERARNLDPAMNCYLIGELLRRSKGEPSAALACYQAAKELFSKIDPSQVKPDIPKGTPVEEARNMVDRAQKSAQKKKDVMLAWTEAQMALVKDKAAGKEPDQRVRDTLARVLSGRIGEPAISATQPDIRIPKTAPATKTDTSPAEPTKAAAPVGKGLTREAVLKAYYAALKAYQKKTGEFPRKLTELVTAGLLKPAEACQNEKGSLICPESGGQLIYFKPTALGTHSPVIFPGGKDPNRIRLFADGKVGEK